MLDAVGHPHRVEGRDALRLPAARPRHQQHRSRAAVRAAARGRHARSPPTRSSARRCSSTADSRPDARVDPAGVLYSPRRRSGRPRRCGPSIATSFTPTLDSGRARRTYGIVRALAAHGPVDLVYGAFGADRARTPPTRRSTGLRLHRVERPGPLEPAARLPARPPARRAGRLRPRDLARRRRPHRGAGARDDGDPGDRRGPGRRGGAAAARRRAGRRSTTPTTSSPPFATGSTKPACRWRRWSASSGCCSSASLRAGWSRRPTWRGRRRWRPTARPAARPQRRRRRRDRAGAARAPASGSCSSSPTSPTSPTAGRCASCSRRRCRASGSRRRTSVWSSPARAARRSRPADPRVEAQRLRPRPARPLPRGRLRRGAAAGGRRLAAEVRRGARLRGAGRRHAAAPRPGSKSSAGEHYVEGAADGEAFAAAIAGRARPGARQPAGRAPAASWPSASTRSRRWSGAWRREDRLGDDRRRPGGRRVRRGRAARRAGRARPRGGDAERLGRRSAATPGSRSARSSSGPKLSARSWPRPGAALAARCAAACAQALEAEPPYDVLLLHYKKEQLLAPGLPAAAAPPGRLGRVGTGAPPAARAAPAAGPTPAASRSADAGAGDLRGHPARR